MSTSKETLLDLYQKMYRIRTFENEAKAQFLGGSVPGFLHLYLGEEAVASGVCENLRKDDYITSTHRGHGHIIAKGGDVKYMMAELFGKSTGYCKGKGGSMHIADADIGILGANGIVGAGMDIAVGAGLSAQYRGTDQVCVTFFGDGASNQGTFHESMNMASIWKLPVIFVCENNLYAISMSQSRHQAIKDISNRAASYGIPGITVDGNDVLAVYEAAGEAIARARKGGGPSLIECKTYRHLGHFVGDVAKYRPPEEVEAWMKKDPLPRYEAYLKESGFSDDELEKIRTGIQEEIAAAVKFAQDSPLPEKSSVAEDVYCNIIEEVRVR
jgi:pyruvate dehydrogenase E1 component alpha subunit